MTCLHEEIKTWYFEDTNQPAGMWSCKSCGHKFVPLRLWVGLTDADIAQTMHGSVEGSNMLPYQFARAIEAKLKEKNT
jgi:hypothetical protein